MLNVKGINLFGFSIQRLAVNYHTWGADLMLCIDLETHKSSQCVISRFSILVDISCGSCCARHYTMCQVAQNHEALGDDHRKEKPSTPLSKYTISRINKLSQK